VAVIGTDRLDIHDIDALTLSLTREGVVDDDGKPVAVKPLKHAYEDVATPFESDPCDCHALAGDGQTDLTLKFKKQELVQQLQLDQVAGQPVALILTGELYPEQQYWSGRAICGQDCLTVVEKDPGGKR
jgi:hypothetical protein